MSFARPHNKAPRALVPGVVVIPLKEHVLPEHGLLDWMATLMEVPFQDREHRSYQEAMEVWVDVRRAHLKKFGRELIGIEYKRADGCDWLRWTALPDLAWIGQQTFEVQGEVADVEICRSCNRIADPGDEACRGCGAYL